MINFCPSFRKLNEYYSVNSVKEMQYYKTEPSPKWEGAETRNGIPK